MPSRGFSRAAVAESVPRLRGDVVDYARRHCVDDPPIADLKLAVAEAINNAVVHAFRNTDPGTVSVRVSVEPRDGEVKVLVTDDGMGFCVNPNSPGLGLGMPLMATLSESMEVRAAEGGRGTEVCMTFALPAGAS